jgi:hypothetical protein
MTKIRLFLLLLACLCSQSLAQDKDHGRGYVPSPFKKELRTNSHIKHGPTLRRLAALPLPATYETPYQIPQQDQGNCGSCWAVSGSIIISCAHVKAGNAKGDGSFVTSADTVMWCYKTGGCNGDDASTVFRIAEADGLPINADVGEYQATGHGSCNRTAKRYKIKASGSADANGDGICSYEEIKTCIFNYGPVICTNDANALIDGEAVSTKRGRGTDHQTVYVGWDDTKVGPGYKGALLMKNQWGNWGFQHNGQMGYCWLAAFTDGTIAASGSEEVLWCQAESIVPPGPPTPVPAPSLFGSLFVENGNIIRGELGLTLTTGKFSYVPTPDGFTTAGTPKFKFIQLAE